MTAPTVVREIRVVRHYGTVIAFGAYAGTGVRHDFVPDEHAGSMCQACFGWRDDARHAYPGRAAQ